MADAEDDFEEVATQRSTNVGMILGGDVEVEYAPILPCLKVPERKVFVNKPFKFPTGIVRKDPTKRVQLGWRPKKMPPPGGSFKKPERTPTPPGLSAEELAAIAAATAAEAAEVADAVVQAAEEAKPGYVKLPEGYQPLVLYKPEGEDAEDGGTVVVEDFLGVHLRDHQREGVAFMFACTHRLKGFDGAGCILADDMGLGKTLQSITLMYTVLKQGMRKGVPTARRVIVVCPTSLVNNWAKEIQKWCGDRIKPLPIADATRDEAIRDITTFLTTRTFPVLIISYDTFRLHAQRFHAREDACDMLICDEAHRLKNDATLTNQALNGLACRRRILLSGTPMQNDLDEFYAMVNFTNPDVLGDVATFRKKYVSNILAAREPWATDKQKEAGEEASRELSKIVNAFVLRRTNTLLSKHLPPKLMQIVCVKQTPLQSALYEHFLQSKSVSAMLAGGKKSGVLSSITALRKLVNHPRLIYDVLRAKQATTGRATGEAAGFEDCEHFFPPDFFRDRSCSPELSGKFDLAARMLTQLRATTKDRIVIVSCYTQTLDLFTTLCRERSFPFIRLDGSTNPGKRQKLVDQFNDVTRDEFVFLLSSKAGGCGLNLIGGNRLILFDPDWNPATDLQAAARVWRDGQRKKVYVYRFLAAGTLEEKVFQRQLSKKGLQTIVVEEGDEVNSLSTDDLRNLFQMNPDTPSDTHDTLRCERCRKEELAEGESDAELEEQRKEGKAAKLAAVAATGEEEAKDGCDSGSGGQAMEAEEDGSAGAAACSKHGGSGGKRATTPTKAAAVVSIDSDTEPEEEEGAAPRPRKVRKTGVLLEPLDEDTEDANDSITGVRGVAASSSKPAAAAASAMDDDGTESEASPVLKPRRRGARGGAGGGAGAGAADSVALTPEEEQMRNDEELALRLAAELNGDDDDEDFGGSGKKRKRSSGGGKKGGAAAKTPKVRGPTKAALKKQEKERSAKQKELDALHVQRVKQALTKALPPVAPGTVRRQMKQPFEDDLYNWSHHAGAVELHDAVLQQVGGDLVSFVFGCEVPGQDLAELNALLDKKEKERAAAAAAEKRAAMGSAGMLSSSSAASRLGSGGILRSVGGSGSSSVPSLARPGGLMGIKRPGGLPLLGRTAGGAGAGAGAGAGSAASAAPRPLSGLGVKPGFKPPTFSKPLSGGSSISGVKAGGLKSGGLKGLGGARGGAGAKAKGSSKAKPAKAKAKRRADSDDEDEESFGSDESEEEEEFEGESDDDEEQEEEGRGSEDEEEEHEGEGEGEDDDENVPTQVLAASKTAISSAGKRSAGTALGL